MVMSVKPTAKEPRTSNSCNSRHGGHHGSCTGILGLLDQSGQFSDTHIRAAVAWSRQLHCQSSLPNTQRYHGRLGMKTNHNWLCRIDTLRLGTSRPLPPLSSQPSTVSSAVITTLSSSRPRKPLSLSSTSPLAATTPYNPKKIPTSRPRYRL